jgi:hypothetical protein
LGILIVFATGVLVLAIVLPRIKGEQEELGTYPLMPADTESGLYRSASDGETSALADRLQDATDAEAVTLVDADGLLADRREVASKSDVSTDDGGGDQERDTAPGPEVQTLPEESKDRA